MSSGLTPFVAVADAIALLMHPQVEVVIHDLGTGRIAHIANAFSRRRVGHKSLTRLDGASAVDARVMGPYAKGDESGRELRSVTAVLRAPEGRPIGLFCINFDVTAVEQARTALSLLTQLPAAHPAPAVLFTSDWQEAMRGVVAAHLRERGLSLSGLSRHEVRGVVGRLDQEGYFTVRNAASHVARLLCISRATVYKHLKDVREHEPDTRPTVLGEAGDSARGLSDAP